MSLPKPAQLVQVVFNGEIIARRRDQAGKPEYLFRWAGAAGDQHEVWYPEAQIKILKEAD